MSASDVISAAGLVVAQQEHRPPAGAHLVLLAGAVVAALAIFGVKWWRDRHEGKSEGRPTTDERSTKATDSTKER